MREQEAYISNEVKQRNHGPHQDQHVLHYGALLDDAKAVMIMVHGRGASAQDILSLAYEIDLP